MSDNNTVWAFGDSYTFGHELSDCPPTPEPNHSHLTYSALVAKHLGYDYKCLAMGYYANNAIARTIIENIHSITDQDQVLVMWTFPIRREFMLDDGLVTIGREDDHDFATHYIKYADLNNVWMIEQSLRDIYIAQELLKDKNYLFLSTVTDLQKSIIDRDDWSSPLANRINLDRWIILDDGLGFHEWSEQQLGVKYTGHPLDPAHKLLAEKINEAT